MSNIIDEIKNAYDKNVLLEIQNQILRREHIVENRKLLKQIRKEFKKAVDGGEAGSPDAERMTRVMKALEEMIVNTDKDLPDIDEQYKRLVEMMKERHPKEIRRVKDELERELLVKGVTIGEDDYTGD